MSYEMVTTGDTGGVEFLHITSTVFRKWKVWRVQFHDGKETFLFKCGNEWWCWSRCYLNKTAVKAVKECIDAIIIRKQLQAIFKFTIN